MGSLSVTDLEKSLVRIFRGNSVVGCGFLVSHTHLLTCAHVVTDALRPENLQEKPTESVRVDFPLVDKGRLVKATVVAWYPVDSGARFEDIAVLQFSIEDLPADAGPIGLSMENLDLNSYLRIPGSPTDWENDLCWATNRRLHGRKSLQYVQIGCDTNETIAIQGGFSGAPVWDEQSKTVIGMMSSVKEGDDGKPEIAAFMIPASVLSQAWSGLAYVELEGILNPYEKMLGRSLGHAYSKIHPESYFTPETLACQLQELNSMDDNCDALVRFVAYLINDLESNRSSNSNESLIKILCDWGRNRTQQFTIVRSEVARRRKIAESVTAYLMVVIKKDLNKKNHYVVEGYFIPDSREYKKNSSKGFKPIVVVEDKSFTYKQLPKVISQFTEDIPSEYDFTIELFLPKELLNQPIEMVEFEQGNPPIGYHYHLIIRSEERITVAAMKKYGRFWGRRWKQMPKPGKKLAVNSLISGDATSFNVIAQQLQQPSIVGLKMIQEPLGTGKSSALAAMYISGAPIAIWLRQPLQNISSTEIDELLNCCLYDLPRIACAQRKEAFPDDLNSHIGSHLALLWDDFDRFPPGYRIADRIDPESGEEKLQIAHNPLKMS
jgi:vWA-MoxR associated protein C-terminal domain/Trypsin-like peptidase domain/vWA-MoxR associated protein middle region (VMAP-M) 1